MEERPCHQVPVSAVPQAITLAGEPMMVNACYCVDCQKRTGSAFSMGAIYSLAALSLSGELSPWERTPDQGKSNTRYSCKRCGNIIYGIGSSNLELIKLHPGTLDDSRNITVDAHIWTRNMQAWISLPTSVLRYDTQPDDLNTVFAAVVAQKQEAADALASSAQD